MLSDTPPLTQKNYPTDALANTGTSGRRSSPELTNLLTSGDPDNPTERPQEKTASEFDIKEIKASPKLPKLSGSQTNVSSSGHHSDINEPEPQTKPPESSIVLATEEEPSTSNKHVIQTTKKIAENEVKVFIGSNVIKEGVCRIYNTEEGTDVETKDAQGRYELSIKADTNHSITTLSSDEKNELFERLQCHHMNFRISREAKNLRSASSIPIESELQPDGSYKYFVNIEFMLNQHIVMYLPPEKSSSELPEEDKTATEPEHKSGITLTMTRISDLPDKSPSKPVSDTPDQKIEEPAENPEASNKGPSDEIEQLSSDANIEETCEDSVSSCGLADCFGFNFRTLRSRHANKTS